MNHLADVFGRYDHWRIGAAKALADYERGIEAAGVGDVASSKCLARLQVRLAEDKLRVVFVSEFSRGKSELINAMFFADYGQRILPSSSGRTTMCPTELHYDSAVLPCIRLLPIETRAEAGSITEFKKLPQCWTTLPLKMGSVDAMQEAFRQVGLTKRVPISEAIAYGLVEVGEVNEVGGASASDGMVEISAWRHAIVNFPHPLLRQGLVIVDTPGLNAIGTEPDLTLQLIPDAHVVLFVLGADTGVTKSDSTLWHDHIGGPGLGRVAVINKIDALWDELRSPAQIDAEVQQQRQNVAQVLGLVPSQVFAVSAQKALLARIRDDAPLLQRSQLPLLEQALSFDLIPARHALVRDQLMQELDALTASRRALITLRLRNVVEQLLELKSLRGKNQKIVAHMAKRIDIERQEFNDSLRVLQATRTVLARLSAQMFSVLGLATLGRDIRSTRMEMDRRYFSKGLRQSVRRFFEQAQANLQASERLVDEIGTMMTAMYRKFSVEHGLAVANPMPFSLASYRTEMTTIEALYQQQFGTVAVLTTSQLTLMQTFFNGVVLRVKQTFLRANQDVQTWLQMLLAPLEAQINEHQAQLNQRRQSIERIAVAADSLQEKLQMLETYQTECERFNKILIGAEASLHHDLTLPPTMQTTIPPLLLETVQ